MTKIRIIVTIRKHWETEKSINLMQHIVGRLPGIFYFGVKLVKLVKLVKSCTYKLINYEKWFYFLGCVVPDSQ